MSDTLRSLFSGSKPQSSGGNSFTPPPAKSGDGAASTGSGYQEVRPDIAPNAVIRVVGVGGGGSNAVSRMISSKVGGVEFIAVNTDAQALFHSPATTKVNIGRGTTRGLGAGANPDIGLQSAKESSEEIKKALEGADLVFITAGLGGGTGSGAAPYIAELARSMGVLTVGVVTKPFSFEGLRRRKQADEALEALRGKVDTLITIPNDKILSLIDKTTPLTEAFQIVDEILRHGIEGIASLITVHGLVNVDFADVRSVMQDAGSALMGIGYGTGDSRAAEAARAAIDSPLLELSISGAKGILFNITGGNDMSMFEVDEAARIVTEAADPEANIIFGAVIDDAYTGQVKCTVIATGFDERKADQMSAAATPLLRQLPSYKKQQDTNKSENPARGGNDDAVIKLAGTQLNEEELEVPTFMRKKIGGK
ncbi:MAG TPA: cell division protein FtsZ [Candidatus Peribacteria bacterium]|nr:cell division protein FtsZ [Candidatus Peribacteria bacterium]